MGLRVLKQAVHILESNEVAIQLLGAHESVGHCVVCKLRRERNDGHIQPKVRGHCRDD